MAKRKMLREKVRVKVVYVTEARVQAMLRHLDLAAKEFQEARASLDATSTELQLRRATVLDCIERLKASVMEDDDGA